MEAEKRKAKVGKIAQLIYRLGYSLDDRRIGVRFLVMGN
jgi:hypothetical protein